MNLNVKTLPRLYITDVACIDQETCFLSDSQSHYLRNVMRKSEGDFVRIFNGRDGEWLSRINKINKNKVEIVFIQQISHQKNRRDVHVYASVVKKEAFEFMIEKACELGATTFTPLVCERTVVRKVNPKRLQMIAIEAAEQSERLDVMKIEPLKNLKDLLNSNDSKQNLIFCMEREKATSLRQTLDGMKDQELSFVIGPEGGFSDQETDLIKKYDNLKRVSLGPQTLRAETALIAAMACIHMDAE